MTITRINHFHAKPGKVAALRDALVAILPVLDTTPGCHSSHLLQSETDADKLLVVEIWESTDAHKASLKNAKADSISQLKDILAEAPNGEYFKNIQG